MEEKINNFYHVNAPIVIFVYNRPEHTRKTLEAISKNILADQSTLYIYSDGPKINSSKETIEKINEVRNIIREKKWCKEVQIIESKKNKGLAMSILEGVTEIVNKYGKVIVLEDDILTSKGFLKYMNDALNIYKDEEKVMHISGYMYPLDIKAKNNNQTFFLNVTSCWGWATWRRAWNKLNTDIIDIYKKLNNKKIIKEFNKYSPDYYQQVLLNFEGKIKTWAIRWFATVFFEGGYCLHPYKSLVNNIGFDNTGEHCFESKKFDNNILAESIEVKKIELKENKFILNKLIKFNKKSYLEVLYNFISAIIPKKLKKIIKKLIFNKNNYEEIFILKNIDKLIKNKIISQDLYKRIFEREILRIKNYKDNPLIIDCGSGIGLNIIYFKKKIPNARIIAFEPNKEKIKTITNNINNFNINNNITLINKALFNKKYNINLDLFYKYKHLNLNPRNITFDAETDILSNYLNEEVDLLIVNIGGFEVEVIEEAEYLFKNIKNIFIEYHYVFDEKQMLHNILKILDDNNFDYYIENINNLIVNPFYKRNYNKYMYNKIHIFGYRN